jgi:TrmH family RNA methyltransferase
MRTPPVTSRANPRVKQLRAAFGGNAKLSGGLVSIEGEHLLQEALRSGLVFKTIFLSERRSAPEWVPGNVERMELSDEVFASAVDTRSPQGIAALLVPPVWSMGDACPPAEAGGNAPLLLIAAGIQDPGNLGTLIRSAEAFGATGVLTSAGTVDEWNQKALRASAGSVFRVPVVAVTPAEIAALKTRGVRLFAAVAAESGSNSVASGGGGAVVSVADADLAGACALMIGNEGAGLSPELLALADASITIPTPGPVESLNAAVAGSLLLYEAARKRTASQLTSNN